LDQVSIGTMDLAKVDNKKHIYMVGMNDGILPQTVSSSSLITDEEKKYVEDNAHVEGLISFSSPEFPIKLYEKVTLC
jgi:ATP-dependent helicase/nuclease subunit B